MPKTTMTTVDKALSLLRFFTPTQPSIGLSELARSSGFDKTTTLRCMTALLRNGFVEQDAQTRKYRIGLSPIKLAQIREQSFPVQSVISPYLNSLADTFGETAHGTLIMGSEPVTAAVSEPDRALFVHVEHSTPLPWHATASGIAISAFLPSEERQDLLSRESLETYTTTTPSNPDQFRDALLACRRDGLARAESTFEDDVVGTAAPIFGQTDKPVGSIAVAAVAHRLTQDLQSRIDTALKRSAAEITQQLGGTALTSPAPF